MRKKIIPILISMLFILSIISVNVFAHSKEDIGIIDNEIPGGLWFVRGSFKYLDEDEESIYLRVIIAKFIGLGQGLMHYSLHFPISIKIFKPFYGFLPTSSIPLPGFGFCKKWEYIESDFMENEKESHYNKIISNNYHIELDGYFGKAYHLLYFKNPNSQILSLMASIIRFNDAMISINNYEFCNDNDGILFVYFYKGIYDHDSNKDKLIMNGDALYLKILLL